MSVRAEETLRNSIDDMWDDIIIPHIFHHNEDLSIQGGMHTHILNDDLSKIKSDFYAMMMMHYEPTIELVISDEIIEDDDEPDDDDIDNSDMYQ